MTESVSEKRSGIPLILLSGFLGSGKTTLFNRILKEGFLGKRIAIVVNDFGKVAVDASLIESDDETMVSLPNGCVCCTLAGNLAAGIDKLLKVDPPFEYIMMETSGVTEVGKVKPLVERGEFSQRVFVDRVIVVCHAQRHARIRKVVICVDEQVRNADVILLNHCDQATAEELDAARATLREANPSITIHETQHCEIDFDLLFSAEIVSGRSDLEKPQGSDQWHTAQIQFSEPVDKAALVDALQSLPEWVYRAKGFARSAEGTIRIERVHQNIDLEPYPQDKIQPDQQDLVVVIGSQPVVPVLEELFKEWPQIQIAAGKAQHSH
jgi:G3E family GTPase